jgi:Concanavalin A-like lectin/glucanases superfamily
MSGSRFFPALSARFLSLAALAPGLGSACSVEQWGLLEGAAQAADAASSTRPASGNPYPPPPPPGPVPVPAMRPPTPDALAPAPAPVSDARAPVSAPAPDAAPAPDSAPAPPTPPMPPPATAPPPTPAGFCPQDEVLVVCLTFDGQVQDLSRARRELAVQGVTLEPGLRGQAGRFGPGRAIQTVNGFRMTEPVLTVEAAVRPSFYPPAGRRAGIVHGDNLYGLFLIGNEGDVECRTPAGGPIVRRAVPLDRWTRIVCVFDEEDVELYINGELADETENDAALGLRQDERPRIGDTNLEGGPLSGLIDELRIWRASREPDDD